MAKRIQDPIWTPAIIKERLKTDDRQVCRGLLAIYNRQTEAEKQYGETVEHNGKGFSGSDANILSSFAEFYKKRGFLSNKQMGIARKKMMKYAAQLSELVALKKG